MASKYLKICAGVFGGLGVIASVVSGCILYDLSITLSILIILIGSLFSVTAMFMLYTWAELVNTQRQMLYIMSASEQIKIPKDVSDEDFVYTKSDDNQ